MRPIPSNPDASDPVFLLEHQDISDDEIDTCRKALKEIRYGFD